MTTSATIEGSETGAPALYLPLGVHLAGSIPLSSSEEVFRTVSERLGDRVRRVPDGETGARADWIVWQYPVLSSQPQFEVAPPSADFYRALPRLKLRDNADGGVGFGSLGYAEAARGSYRTFAELKRAGVVPSGCRFQVSLPTPLAPISAFVAEADQREVEEPYTSALVAELEQLLDAIPHDQLALQWDTNFEFGMLEGEISAWFPDVKSGVLERLIRLSRLIPADVELGFHFCYGDGKDARRKPQSDMSRVVEIANAISASLGRPLNWIHMPAVGISEDGAFYEPLRDLRLGPETELYLGLLDPDADDARTSARIAAAHDRVGEFGVATPCGWGRLAAAKVPRLIEAHGRHSRPVTQPREGGYRFEWPEGVARIPADDWVEAPVDTFGLQYDTVEHHGWYRNLDPTVDQLAGTLRDGDVLIDYSGGTGILLNRLLLRIFDRQIGMMIVDSSPKFLRVALEHFRSDDRVAFRRLRYLKDEHRLQLLDEVLDHGLQADVIVSTNAIHLYYDLEETLGAWHRVLKPGGRVVINSGNVRNPQARANEWILDETVYVIHEVATGIVRSDPRWEKYRPALEDEERLARHLEFRDRVFIPPRPLEYYLDALRAAAFEIEEVDDRTIEADVDDWYELMSTYHDAVLPWVGGSEKVDGVPPTPEALEDRLTLIRQSLDTIFGGRKTFLACWTYIEASKA
jgi:ubiquinone/menaquinone biosynthesis C-methylase UbiE